MQNKENIFQALDKAIVVGGVTTSMQGPEVDKDVLKRAIAGQADDNETALLLYSGDDEPPLKYTVGDFQGAREESEGTWVLSSGTVLWIS